jgi:hypothetical protein|tara:strand:- start:6203 stop:6781 length:579 start_codon:yes stop_codon:yes gene_type:complete
MSFVQFIEGEYKKVKNTFSDINEHIELLYTLGMECDKICEMGVRDGASTRAFLNTNASLRSYDIELNQEVVMLFNRAKQVGKDVTYEKANVLNIDIDQCDLLFIDTWHSGSQLKRELKIHGNKANKYLVFHDTQTYGCRDEKENWRDFADKRPMPNEGLISPIINFVIENPEWKFKEFRTNNNGLTVLERTK